jgi:hypothetical protein
MVPTLWIVLGPLGQSITAVNLLGGVAPLVLPPPSGTALAAFGVVYGIPVGGWMAVMAFVLFPAPTTSCPIRPPTGCSCRSA